MWIPSQARAAVVTGILLCLVPSAARVVTFLNWLEGGVNVYWGATPDRMTCVGSVASGARLQQRVGRLGDVFLVERREASCPLGLSVSRRELPLSWSHDRDDSASVLLLETEVVGVWTFEERDVLDLAWALGTDAILFDDDPMSVGSRRYLGLAVALGDETAGAASAVMALALDEEEDDDDTTLSVSSTTTTTLRRHSASWLAKLAIGFTRSKHGRRLNGTRFAPFNCETSSLALVDVLRDVASPGARSPEGAVARPRHAVATPNSLLVDLWLRADGETFLLDKDDDWERVDDDFPSSSSSSPPPPPSRSGGGGGGTMTAERQEVGRLVREAETDVEAALEAGDLFLEGVVVDGRDFGFETSPLAAKHFYEVAVDKFHDPDARAALAELLLGGFEGVAADVRRAMDLVSIEPASAFGWHLRAHLSLVLDYSSSAKEEAAIDAWRRAIDEGCADARVSLGLFLLSSGGGDDDDSDDDVAEGLRLLKIAADYDLSLTANLALAEHLLGLGGDRRAAFAGRRKVWRKHHCDEANERLFEAVQHAWQTDDTAFGLQTAAFHARAAWHLRDPAAAAAAAAGKEEDTCNDDDKDSLFLGRLRSTLQKFLKNMPRPRRQQRQRREDGLDQGDVPAKNWSPLVASLRRELAEKRSRCRSARARAVGAYRLYAAFGAVGVVAADMNAGFLARRLAVAGLSDDDEFFWNGRAKDHYERAARFNLQDDETRLESASAVPLAVRTRSLERAEAMRSIADCYRNRWRGACDFDDDAGEEPPEDNKKNRKRASELTGRASDLGSEWAMFDAAVDAPAWSDAIDEAKRCAFRFEWPHSAPCHVLFLFYTIAAPLADLASFAWSVLLQWPTTTTTTLEGGLKGGDDDDDEPPGWDLLLPPSEEEERDYYRRPPPHYHGEDDL